MRAVGRAFLDLALPANLARFEVDAINHPPVNVCRRFALAAEVQPFFRLLGISRADNRCNKYMVAPDGGRTPSRARNLGGPGNVLGRAPFIGQVRIFGDAERTGPSESGPVVACSGSTKQYGDEKRAENRSIDHDVLHWTAKPFETSAISRLPLSLCLFSSSLSDTVQVLSGSHKNLTV